MAPGNYFPQSTVQHGGKLVIVNKDPTPLDSKAHLCIHAPADQVM